MSIVIRGACRSPVERKVITEVKQAKHLEVTKTAIEARQHSPQKIEQLHGSTYLIKLIFWSSTL